MRPKYLAGVIVGLLLIYISLFGVSGFGFSLSGATENFSTFTEVDPSNAISVTSNKVTINNLLDSYAGLVYKSMGTALTGNFEIEVSCEMTAQVSTGFTIFTLQKDFYDVNAPTFLTIYIETNRNFALYTRTNGGALGGGLSQSVAALNVLYLVNLKRVSGAVVATVTTVGTPVCTLTVSDANAYNVLFVTMSANNGQPTHYRSGWLQDLRIAGSTPTTYSDVTISVFGQGSTVPAVGHYTTTYSVGGSLTITATPASGWTFSSMTRNGATTSSMTITSLGASEQIAVYFTQGSPTTGTLRITASYNGAYVVATVTATGPQTVTGSTTTDSNNPLAFTVTAGTYIVSGTYASGSAMPVTVTVPAGGSVDANLNFGGSPPPSDFIALINAFLNLLAVKTLFLVSGLASTIVCGIMFVRPAKGARARPSQFPSYY